jgi:hypothetical protein
MSMPFFTSDGGRAIGPPNVAVGTPGLKRAPIDATAGRSPAGADIGRPEHYEFRR